jgi:NADH-ubiquinone oxidoreductase chain 2
MLTITLIALILAIPLSSTVLSTSPGLFPKGDKVRKATISATLFTRIVAIALLFAAALSYNCFSTMSLDALDAGVGLYSGLIHATTITQSMEVFLLVSGALILLPWSNTLYRAASSGSNYAYPTIPEYPMLILFTTMGGTFLLASADLVSMYLAIELQSFGVYILAAVYRDSESATAAGLKYFLLGALSSALILLGSALVYSYTGLTNLNSIYELISVPSAMSSVALPTGEGEGVVVLGLVIISVGLLFKVASAPFHYWAPDVYDGTPTIVTTWLTVMPKIAIFLFLLELYIGTGAVMATSFIEAGVSGSQLLLICAFLSLVIGTVVGLGQYRIKRLLAYSTISHVGFLLLALAVPFGGSSTTVIAGEESVEAFLFYIMQYSLTNINAFFVLLAFGYLSSYGTNKPYTDSSGQIQFTSELLGQFRANPVLGLSFAICLFSMAGVPPLVGFFAKYTVLYSAINNGYVFLAIVAILASVVSAVYYLRIIRVIHFGSTDTLSNPVESNIYNASLAQSGDTGITSVHSYIIASLTLFITLFAVNPTLILNSTSIMALSLYCR